jgi:hypothetical protein
MSIDNMPELPQVFAQADTEVKRMDTIRYHLQLPRLVNELKSIPALDMGIAADKPSAVVKFMQEALNHQYKNKGAGEDGLATERFVARVNQFAADNANFGLPVVKSFSEISGAHLSAIIDKQSRGFLGSDNDRANRLMAEALLSIDNQRMKEWGGRFNPYPGKPVRTSSTVPGTGMTYDSTTNTLTV